MRLTALSILGAVLALLPGVFSPEREAKASEAGARRTYVVLTTARADEPFYAVAKKLAKHRKAKKVLTLNPKFLAQAVRGLRKTSPEMVAVVLPREDLDLNFARAFLAASTALDDDPYVDFAYGFITAGDAGKAMAFVDNIVKAEKRKDGPKSVTSVGILDGTRGAVKKSFVRPTAGYESYGYAGRTLNAVDIDPEREAFLKEHVRSLEGNALLSFFGHGSPLGVQHGYTGKVLNEARLNLFPAVVVSCACYTGTVHGAFMELPGGIRRQVFPEEELFSLALIHAGATGVFAGVGPWHGVLAQEVTDLCLLEGLPCGEAARRMYNRLALGWGAERLSFEPLKDGAPVSRDPAILRKFTPSNLVYLGDPAYRPFPPQGKPPIEAAVVESEGERIVIRLTSRPRAEIAVPWVRMSYLLADRRLQEVAVSVPLPAPVRKVKSAALLEAKAGGAAVALALEHWQVEEHGGKRFLHVVLACDEKGAHALRMRGLKADLGLSAGR